MKKRIVYSATAFLISVCMLITGIPVNAFTEIGSSSVSASADEDIKNLSDSFYAQQSAKNLDWYSTSIKAISDALSFVSVESTASKVGVWAGQQFLSILMNSTQPDATETILAAVNELYMQNQTTLLKLDQLSGLVKDQAQLNSINQYFNGNDVLFVKTKIYMGALQNTEGLSDAQVEKNRKNIMIWSVGNTTNVDELNLADKSMFDTEVLAFGNKLQDTIYLTDGSCSPLELMNNYSLGHFKWEHQGYEMRENYWSSLVNLYTTSANIMYVSLNARIEAYEAVHGENSASILRSKLKTLTETSENIKKIGKKTVVKRLSDDLRRYQVKGHEITLRTKATKQTLPYRNAGNKEDFDCPKGRKTNSHWDSFYMYTDENNNTYEALSEECYRMFYNDYNPSGSTTKTSLYDIFFSPENGALTPPEKGEGTRDWMFVTNDLKTVHNTFYKFFIFYYGEEWIIGDVLLNSGDCSYVKWDWKSIFDNKYTNIAYYTTLRGTHIYIDEDYCDSFVMVMADKGQYNSIPGTGTGQEEYKIGIPATVTFDAKGGTVEPKTVDTDLNGYISELPVPVYDGYSFDGWYTSENVKVTKETQFKDDTTVYAKWVKIEDVKAAKDSVGSSPDSTGAPQTGNGGYAVIPILLIILSVFAIALAYIRKDGKLNYKK